AALRIQARATNAVARRTIVGPWVHGLPDHAYPAPNIDWLHELVRWFDRWLRDVQNGTETEPALTWFQRDPTPPERFPARLNGAWRAASGQVPEQAAGEASLGRGSEIVTLHLDGGDVPGRGRLMAAAPLVAGIDGLDHHPTAGTRAGSLCWGAGHPPNGLAADLRLEEPFGPVYVSAPLDEALEILGAPVVTLVVSSSEPVAHLVARLGCVAPDGCVEQVSEGILNLTHRDSHADPSALEPGRTYEVRVRLRTAGYRVPPGYRIWLGVASAHWPVIWPSPRRARLSIRRGPDHASRLDLPLAPIAGIEPVPAFRTEAPALLEVGSETTELPTWELHEDPARGEVAIRTYEAGTTTLPEPGGSLFISEALSMTASEREPGAGRFENTCHYTLERGGLRVEVVADGTTIAGGEAFEMEVGLAVDVDGQRFFERRLRESIPRDLL
ncbi:MAG TPA: CocE/NonD family hydrolase, partial [Candidatus Limnocylindrales bacterium]